MLHINITKSSKKKTNLLLARSAMSAAQGCCVADDERATPGNGAASGQLSLSLCRESRVSLAAATKAASPVLRFASSLSLSSRLRAHPEKRRRARALMTSGCAARRFAHAQISYSAGCHVVLVDRPLRVALPERCHGLFRSLSVKYEPNRFL